MKILNFGSLNLDHVYHVAQIVAPGQTVDSLQVCHFPGGKGLNQTLALARAGVPLYHAGMIGSDGLGLKELLEQDHVDCTYLKTVETDTGSAFIQVDANGQNSIVLSKGANGANTHAFCDEVLAEFGAGDMLLLQNEISCIDYLIEKAAQKQMQVVLNPSPINQAVLACDLKKISVFILNEDEGMQISGKSAPEDILAAMAAQYPQAQVVLTLGSKGAVYQGNGQTVWQNAFSVKAVDTTAAGDTFTGYLLAGMIRGLPMPDCLLLASKAAALAVTVQGAASSIPYRCKVDAAELTP